MADRAPLRGCLLAALTAVIVGFGLAGAASTVDAADGPGPGVKVLFFETLPLRNDTQLSVEQIRTSEEKPPLGTQAGGHPDLYLAFGNEYSPDPARQVGSLKNATVHLPAGLIGNPHATPQCSSLDFSVDRCPIDSQVGYAEFSTSFNGTLGSPVFNLEPSSEQAGLTGFKTPLFDYPVFTVLSARTGGDYGLDATVRGVASNLSLANYFLKLWGVPADPANDHERYGPIHDTFPGTPPNISSSPRIPFLSAPTTCTGPLTSEVEILAYDRGVNRDTATWPATTGCDQLGFKPSLSAQPSTPEADSPSGLDVDLSVPQSVSPNTPSDSQIKEATVTLPKGFSINPNAVDGKAACSDADAHFGSEAAATCPEFAKVGTLTLTSSALPAPLPGAIYLGEPKPGDRYRLILTADGFATHVKLAGSVSADGQTGQLSVVFQNLPQAPFTRFQMHFFGSERGLMATPTQCGKYAVDSTFVPWDAVQPDQTSTQFFTLDSGPGGGACPGGSRPFGPTMLAATRSSGAGSHSPLSIELSRTDGDQNLSALSISTPPGFLASIRGIPYCSDAALGEASDPLAYSGISELSGEKCPAGSRVGSSIVGVGAGTHPLYLAGKVFLAGPYKGAPLSLAVVTPAVSGPYDLGNVVVRVALHLDPESAQITAIADPLPQIVDGIPLRLRAVQLNLDRPDFTLLPTNCDPFAITGQIGGSEGAVVVRSRRFQASNCDVLPFKPSFTARLSGATKRTGDPALKATLIAKPGEANVAKTTVTMPHTLFLDNAHLNAPCTRPLFAARECPASSVIGSAKVETPLLDQPLEGPVYLRASSHKLPDIVADLRGQIGVVLVGRVDSVNSRLRTSFETVPDAPITRFTLSLVGGKKGLLEISENLCVSPLRAKLQLVGQNGVEANEQPRLQTPCGSKSRHKRHAKNVRKAAR
jgi:hypothetical protein